MSVQKIDNFDYRGQKPNFARDSLATLADLSGANVSDYPDGHIVYCQETDLHYKFNSSNEMDEHTGRFRLFQTGGKELSEIQSHIALLQLDAHASLLVSPEQLYKHTSSSITLEGRLVLNAESADIVADKICLYRIDSDRLVLLSEATGVNSHVYTLSDVTLYSDQKYEVVVTCRGMVYSAKACAKVYYPIYCGMGSSPNSVAVDGNKLTARSSAVGTYTKTASGDNERLFLLVPTGVTCPTKFAMGGSPFAVTTTTMEINGIPYTVIESGGTYNSGTTVTVVAS